MNPITLNRNHGIFRRHSQECVCNEGYTGDDCSESI